MRLLASSLRSRLYVALAVGSCALALAREGRAASEAETLFDRGVAEMLAGHFREACPIIERSFQLEPLAGVMFTLAECLAGAGKTATALARYADFRTLLVNLPSERRVVFEERERLALRQIDALSRRVPDLRIDVPRPAPDLVVTINGEVLEPPAYGVKRLVDPGRYVVVAEAEGRPRWEKTLEISDGQHPRLVVPAPAPVAPSRPAPAAEAAVAPSAGRSPARTWAYVSGGVGLAGLVVGGSAGVLAWSKKSDVDRHCPGQVCDPEGMDAVNSGRSAATVANIGVAVGVAGLAGSLLLFVLHPGEKDGPGDSARAHLDVVGGPESALLGVRGRFQ